MEVLESYELKNSENDYVKYRISDFQFTCAEINITYKDYRELLYGLKSLHNKYFKIISNVDEKYWDTVLMFNSNRLIRKMYLDYLTLNFMIEDSEDVNLA